MAKFQKLRVVIFSLFLLLPTVHFSQDTTEEKKSVPTVITVERAERTESRKDPETGNSLIIFEGGVLLTVEREDTTISIAAQLVQFDRERQQLFASGDITFNQKKGSEEEVLTADNLLLNVKTLDGFFDETRISQEKSEAINIGSDSVMVVFADITGRDESGTIAFKNADLTFCDEPDPHWKVKASRIWLLPGNEFAFFNALIFVGPIPVAYLPFFYYPKDEMILNPVFGSREREGYFFQTTTYLLGRKPLSKAEDEESLYNFIQPTELKEQKLEGLFLRNLDEPYSKKDNHTLKLMADYYTALGFMVGLDGKFGFSNSIVKELTFDAYFGFSRNLYNNPLYDGVNFKSRYVPYNPDLPVEEQASEWNKSNLFGLELPFRYTLDFAIRISDPVFSLNATVMLPSDQYFKDDYLDRSEFMDWLSYATNLGNSGSVTSDSDATLITSFNWLLSGSFTPKITFLNPFINRFSISGIESSVAFYSKTNSELTGSQALVDPLRTFFYPHQITPIKFSVSLSGSLYSSNYDYDKNKTKTETDTEDLGPSFSPSMPAMLDKSQTHLNEFGEQLLATDGTPMEATVTTDEETASTAETAKAPPFSALFFTPSISAPGTKKVEGFVYDLSYSLTGNFSSTLLNETANWNTVSDINWGQFESSYYYITGSLGLTNNLNWLNGFVSAKSTFTFSPSYYAHPYISESKTESEVENIQLSDFKQRKLNLTNTNTLTFAPFIYTEHFSGTNLTWNTGVKILDTQWAGTVDNPQWDYNLPEWKSESFSDHSLTANLAAKQGDFSQSLALSMQLSPMLDKYTAALSIGMPYTSMSLSTGMEKKSIDDKEFKFLPITQSASFSKSIGNSSLSVSQNLSYELEENRFNSVNLSASWFGLTLNYEMLYTYGYTYTGTRWQAETEQRFLPYRFSFSYNSGSFDFKWGKSDTVVFSFNLNTSLALDLIRISSTKFTFTPSFTLKIKNVMDITFSSDSQNSVVYRYFQENSSSNLRIPGETNLFKDLWNSFAFWDEGLRKSSGFKLKNLNFRISHSLHDWTLAFEVKLSPRQLTDANGRAYYDFSPYWALSVVWKPFASMKTNIVDDYGTIKLNPQT